MKDFLKKFNPFKMQGSCIMALVFVVVSFYVLANKGDLPSILIEKQGLIGETTFLGKIILAIVFPTAMLGLTIEGVVPSFVYLFLVFVFEFIYGFLVGWGIHSLFRILNRRRL